MSERKSLRNLFKRRREEEEDEENPIKRYLVEGKETKEESKEEKKRLFYCSNDYFHPYCDDSGPHIYKDADGIPVGIIDGFEDKETCTKKCGEKFGHGLHTPSVIRDLIGDYMPSKQIIKETRRAPELAKIYETAYQRALDEQAIINAYEMSDVDFIEEMLLAGRGTGVLDSLFEKMIYDVYSKNVLGEMTAEQIMKFMLKNTILLNFLDNPSALFRYLTVSVFGVEERPKKIIRVADFKKYADSARILISSLKKMDRGLIDFVMRGLDAWEKKYPDKVEQLTKEILDAVELTHPEIFDIKNVDSTDCVSLNLIFDGLCDGTSMGIFKDLERLKMSDESRKKVNQKLNIGKDIDIYKHLNISADSLIKSCISIKPFVCRE